MCKVWIQLSSLNLWVNCRAVWNLEWDVMLEKEVYEFEPVKFLLKIDLVSHPARVVGLGKHTHTHTHTHTHKHTHTHTHTHIYIYPWCINVLWYKRPCVCTYMKLEHFPLMVKLLTYFIQPQIPTANLTFFFRWNSFNWV